jgi:hypothetical protein
MPRPDMVVLAEGDGPTGQRWVLRAGGTIMDFYTLLATTHSDGRRDEGGMGGPPLPAGSLMNTYTGGTSWGMRRVLVRADPRVARVQVELGHGEKLDLAPVATWPDWRLVFFATLLPPAVRLVSAIGFDESGELLEPHFLSREEEMWQRFRRRHGQDEG